MDGVVLVAESWPLLLGLPVLAGAVAFTLVAVAPTYYRAVSNIPLIEGAQTLINSSEFASQFEASGLAVDDFVLTGHYDSAIRSTVITATTTTNTEAAEAAAARTIETLRIMSPVRASSLAQQVDLLKAQIGRLEDFTTSLETSVQTSTSDGTSVLGITDAVVALTDTVRSKQETLVTLEEQLAVAERIAAVPPEIVAAPVPKDRRAVLAAMLGAATLASALVYIRFRLIQARKVAGFAAKRARIIRALTLNLFGGRTGNDPKS